MTKQKKTNVREQRQHLQSTILGLLLGNPHSSANYKAAAKCAKQLRELEQRPKKPEEPDGSTDN